jgi:hypothetical protein
MSYIGNTTQTQAFSPVVDYFSGNGSTTAFTLSRPVASVAQVQVTIDNVAQNPSSAFTVSSNTITFTSAPLSGTNNIYVYYTSPITQVIAPGQNTVYPTSLSTTNALYWDTSGNVGIGTTSPSTQLQVTTAITGDVIRVANGTQSLNLGVNNGSGGSYLFENNANALRFGTNGTERMRIDSSGNVGIGVTSLATSTTPQLQIGAQTVLNNISNNTSLGNNASYNGGAWKYIATAASSLYQQTGGVHYFYVAGSGTAGNSISYTEALRINASGYVTLPSQPVFSAYIGNGGSTAASVSANSKITCTAAVNISSSFSNANSRFTAPVTGSYQFNTNVEIQGTASGRYGIVFYKNGSQYVADIEYFQAGSGNWQNASMSCVIPMSVGDYLELYTESVPTGALVWYSSNPGGNGNFSGYLIG